MYLQFMVDCGDGGALLFKCLALHQNTDALRSYLCSLPTWQGTDNSVWSVGKTTNL